LKKLTILFISLVLATTLASCGKNKDAGQKTAANVQAKVLATVNDVPLTEYDLKLIQKRIPTGMGVHQGAEQNVLETLVRDELIYQKGLELGLDKNPAYGLKLAEIEAQLRAFKRQEMSALYMRDLNSKAEVTDAELQAYFDKNAQKMQTRFHVMEIFYRGNEAQIVKALQDLKSGVSFEKVAARQFPSNLPATMKAPWDLGEMYWNQIPEAWKSTLERLQPGQISDIIKGPKERYWVIKLVKKTVDPKITIATEKQKLMEVLRQQKSQELYDKMLSEIKVKAKIVFPK